MIIRIPIEISERVSYKMRLFKIRCLSYKLVLVIQSVVVRERIPLIREKDGIK